MCGGQITVKNWRNLPISNPKWDHHNINAHTKFDENPLRFTCYHPAMKICTCCRQITVRKWWNLTISNPKPDLHNINDYTKFYKSPLILAPVIVQKQKYGWTDVRQMDTWTTNVKLKYPTTIMWRDIKIILLHVLQDIKIILLHVLSNIYCTKKKWLIYLYCTNSKGLDQPADLWSQKDFCCSAISSTVSNDLSRGTWYIW